MEEGGQRAVAAACLLAIMPHTLTCKSRGHGMKRGRNTSRNAGIVNLLLRLDDAPAATPPALPGREPLPPRWLPAVLGRLPLLDSCTLPPVRSAELRRWFRIATGRVTYTCSSGRRDAVRVRGERVGWGERVR